MWEVLELGPLVVDRANGQVHLDGSLNGGHGPSSRIGCVFSFVLSLMGAPLHLSKGKFSGGAIRTPEGPPAVIIPSLLTGTSRPTRILVADDDPVILRLLQVNFNLEGYEVHTATRGEEALDKAREHLPDIILLDVMMPGVDGWEVCRQLKEDQATAAIPVIFLSARAQDQDRRRGYELGVVAYVTKPFDPGELIEVVQRSLEGPPAPQE